MHVGNVIKLFRDKEYGSIRTQSGEDAHFHKLCLWDIQFADLSEGQEVEFEIQPSYKGFLAFHIRPSISLLAKETPPDSQLTIKPGTIIHQRRHPMGDKGRKDKAKNDKRRKVRQDKRSNKN